MNHEELDRVLRLVTKSEEIYQKIGRNNSFDFYDTCIINEREVIKATIPQNLNDYPNHNELQTMFMRKNSRFCTTPRHIHDWIEINYMYDGSCIETIGDTPFELKKGQAILIDKDMPHEIGYLGENDILYSIMIHPDYLNLSFFNRISKGSVMTEFFVNAMNQEKEHNSFVFFRSEDNKKLPFYMAELACELMDPSDYSSDIIDSLFTLVLYELIDAYNLYNQEEDKSLNTSSLASILKYIERNYKICTLDSIAHHFGLNTSYLSTLFKTKLNMNYIDLIQKQRFHAAIILLENTDRSIADIAHEVGYENINFFYRKFKEIYRCSPKEYRQNKRNR